MKEKEILQVIKNDIVKNTPDILSKINLSKIVIKEEPKIHQERKQFNLFKILAPTFALALMLVIIVVSVKNNSGIETPLAVSVTDKDRIVAKYTTTGVSLIANSSSSNMKMGKKISDNEIITEFHEYIDLIEDYFALSSTDIEIVKNHQNEDYQKYDYQMKIVYTSAVDKKIVYEMYYNEKRTIDDDEETKLMTGVLVFEEIVFNFKTEEESEEDEKEVKVVIYQDNYANRIEIEKEYENDEFEYEYLIYQNNKVIKEIKLEVEDDIMELEVKMISKEDVHYIIERNKTGKFMIEYEAEEDGEFTLTIDKTTKNYYYKINNAEITK